MLLDSPEWYSPHRLLRWKVKPLLKAKRFTEHWNQRAFLTEFVKTSRQKAIKSPRILFQLAVSVFFLFFFYYLCSFVYYFTLFFFLSLCLGRPLLRDRVFIFAHAYQKRGQCGKHHTRSKRPVQDHKEWEAEKAQPVGQEHQSQPRQDCRAGAFAAPRRKGLEGTSEQRVS